MYIYVCTISEHFLNSETFTLVDLLKVIPRVAFLNGWIVRLDKFDDECGHKSGHFNSKMIRFERQAKKSNFLGGDR